jgi:hypothetical protein
MQDTQLNELGQIQVAQTAAPEKPTEGDPV